MAFAAGGSARSSLLRVGAVDGSVHELTAWLGTMRMQLVKLPRIMPPTPSVIAMCFRPCHTPLYTCATQAGSVDRSCEPCGDPQQHKQHAQCAKVLRLQRGVRQRNMQRAFWLPWICMRIFSRSSGATAVRDLRGIKAMRHWRCEQFMCEGRSSPAASQWWRRHQANSVGMACIISEALPCICTAAASGLQACIVDSFRPACCIVIVCRQHVFSNATQGALRVCHLHSPRDAPGQETLHYRRP